MIKGQVEKITKNKYGFYGVKVSGDWYNLSKKEPTFKEGQIVEFDYYLKDDKYKTVKGSVAVLADAPAKAAPSSGAAASRPASGGSRDTYWTDKAAADAEREPRIAYQGAYERAIEVFKIVDAKGGYPSLEKTKPADRLEAVRAFIEAEADNIMALAYAAKPPKAAATAGAEASEDAEPAEKAEENWE